MSDVLKLVDKRTEENPELEAKQLVAEIFERFGIKHTERTVSRYRRDLGWVFERTRYCQFIRKVNKEKRLEWCQRMRDNKENFSKFVFTDECTAQLETTRKRRYQKWFDAFLCLQGKVKHPLKLHVWAGISARGATDIVIFDGAERLNARNYITLLESFYVPFAGKAYNDNSVLVQDNAPMLTAHIRQKFLRSNGVGTIDWPPESPDLNCIELVWHQMKVFI